jgi:two-component system nitrogen regulation response regulator NtrX
VFLEDVDALPRGLQGRLAAWLSSNPDVRVLASAAPDPVGLMEPLKAHVDVIRVEIAPLRERRGDIAPLAARFMRDLAREYGRAERTIEPEAMAALVRHGWPANVRGLRNVVERLLLLAPTERVRPQDLPHEMGGAAEPVEDLYASFATLDEGRRAFDRYFLRRALREAGGDADAAARRAGIAAAELRARIG